MGAISAKKYNPNCRELYQRLLEKGKPKKVALGAVANKLIRQIFAVVKYDQAFEPSLEKRGSVKSMLSPSSTMSLLSRNAGFMRVTLSSPRRRGSIHLKPYRTMDSRENGNDIGKKSNVVLLTDSLRVDLKNWVIGGPIMQGYPWNNRTCSMLRIHLFDRTKILCCDERIRQVLHSQGLTWKKPRHKPPESPDPLKAEKLARIQALKDNLKPNEIIVYQDESDFNLFCPLRRCWQEKGTQKEIATPGNNQRVYAFSCYHPESGKFNYIVSYKKRTQDFINFLHRILYSYPANLKIYMIVDNYSVHHSKRVRDFRECLLLYFLFFSFLLLYLRNMTEM